MIDQEKSTKLKVLKPKSKLDADEGVARGNGASPLDQRGEPLEDPLHLGPEVGGRPHQRLQQLLHLLPQDQEAPRVLGEAQSRVSEILGGMGVGGFPSNLADCILIPAGVVRCGETWGRFMLGGKYLEWSDPLFLLHPRWLELFQQGLIRRLFASKAPRNGQRALILKLFLFYCQAKMVKRQHKNGRKVFSFHRPNRKGTYDCPIDDH